MRRTILFRLTDPDGATDDLVSHLLHGLRPHAERVIVIADDEPPPQSGDRLAALCDSVTVVARDPEGERHSSDWRTQCAAALATVGSEDLADADEVLIVDDRIIGPIHDFSELFTRMDGITADLWGLTSAVTVTPDGSSAEDLSTSWLGVRADLLAHPDWRAYWEAEEQDVGPATFLARRGHRWVTAWPRTDYPGVDPFHTAADLLVRDGCPVVPAALLAGEPSRWEQQGVLGRRVLTQLESADFPLRTLWRGLARRAEPRHVYTNLSLLEVLPEADSGWRPDPAPRVGVLAHIYYDDMVEAMMRHIGTIPVPYTLDVTTDTERKRASILRQLEGHDVASVTVRVVESNQGRDTSAFLIGQRDVLLSDDFDLICRVHSKKSPQDAANVASLFRDHLYDNLLASSGYVAEVLRLFEENPTLGMAFPPVINIGYPTLGHAWFANREPARALADELGIGTRFDATTPLAAYGSMFWARPQALRTLVSHPWQWSDFPADDAYKDGSLTHVLERLLVYAALDLGFHVRSVITREWAGINYPFLEYKLERISSRLPAGTEEQLQLVDELRRRSTLLGHLKHRMTHRHPMVGRSLRPAYTSLREIYRRSRGRS